MTEQFAAQDTPNFQDVNVATLSLPAGTYLLEANGVAEDDIGHNNGLGLSCNFDRASTPPTEAVVNTNEGVRSFSLTDLRSMSAGDIHLVCADSAAHTHVKEIIMTALAVGTVH